MILTIKEVKVEILLNCYQKDYNNTNIGHYYTQLCEYWSNNQGISSFRTDTSDHGPPL